MRLRATVELWQKGKWFIAKVPELDFIAQGKIMEEAKSNLNKVINIQFREMREMGTLDDYLAECGFIMRNDTAEPDTSEYPIKVKVSDAEMAALRITTHSFHGEWNYTINPTTAQS